MPILFDFYASPFDPEKEEKEKYHARGGQKPYCGYK